jgi:hypothetical protein
MVYTEARIIQVCISLMVISLLLIVEGEAKIDPKSAAGVWLFDEDSGQVAKDSSENGYDGKLIGSPKWVKGKFGKALDFNGSTDYVEVNSEPGLNITGDITITAWIFKRPAGRGTIVGKWRQKGDVWSYVLYDRGEPGGGWRLRWDDQSQTNLEGPYTFPDGKWVHNAATYDGDEMKVFADGKEIGKIAANKKTDVTENPLWIGNDGYQQHFNGIIDEVAIFDVSLTPEEIETLMTNGLSDTLAVSPMGKIALTWGRIKTGF